MCTKLPMPSCESHMPTLSTPFLLACLLVPCLTGSEGTTAPDYPALVEALTKVDHPDVGYSAMMTGSSFLPYGEASMGMMLLKPERRRPSPTLTALVTGGAKAMPALIVGLSDAREIPALPTMKAMMWMSFPDEYDWNRQATRVIPVGVNRDRFEPGERRMEHRLTVGDLCFNAIGQIVNRSFNAVRYQPTGGLVVNSPTTSPALLAAVMAEWKDLTPAEHLRRLQADFTNPDHPARRSGAALRLAFYAPQEMAALVVPYLSTPSYDVFGVWNFVRDHLYRAKPEVWNELVRQEVERLGGHWRVGILHLLFDDLGSVEATEEKRTSSPFEHGDLPRRILIEVFGFPKTVRSQDLPFSDVESTSDRARFIGSLVHDTDPAITAAVEKVLRECDDDYLALACFRRCVRVGRIEAVQAACDRLLPRSTTWRPKLEQTKAAIMAKKAERKPMTLADLPEWR